MNTVVQASQPAAAAERDISSLYARWWPLLQQLYPATGALHVGAGTGASLPPYAAAQVPRVRLVEADRELLPELDTLAQSHPGWSCSVALVAENTGEADFCVASNTNESGLLGAARLQGIWRNLRAHEHRRVPATTLHALLHDAPEVNWLVVDCLPAGAILRGAGPKLAQVEVVLARVVLANDRVAGAGAALTDVEPWLQAQGFHIMATAEERHPAIGMALFVRDWKRAQASTLAELAALRTSTTEAQRQLAVTRDEQAKLATERQAQLQALTQAKAEADKAAAERQAQLDALGQGKTAADKLAADRAAQIEQLTKARDEQAKLAADRQAQIDTLTQTRVAAEKLAGERGGQLEQLTKARDEQAKLAADRQAQIDTLTQAKAAAEKAVADKTDQVLQLTQLGDEKAKLAAERQLQVGVLDTALSSALAEVARLETELNEQASETLAMQAQRTAAVSELEVLKAAMAALQTAKTELEAKVQWRGDQMNQLKREQEEQRQLAQAAAQQRDQTQATVTDLQTQLDVARTEIEAARGVGKRAEQDSRGRIAALEDEISQLRLRQRLLDEEMIKAEGQIELIKDVLLREPSL